MASVDPRPAGTEPSQDRRPHAFAAMFFALVSLFLSPVFHSLAPGHPVLSASAAAIVAASVGALIAGGWAGLLALAASVAGATELHVPAAMVAAPALGLLAFALMYAASHRHARRSERRQGANLDTLVRLGIEAIDEAAIILVTPQGRVATWNQGAARLFGYDAAELLGAPYGTLYLPPDRARGLADEELATARRAGSFHQPEGWRARKDGSRFRSSVSVTPLWEADVFRGYCCVLHDVTAHAQAEERYRELVDGVKDYAIFLTDPEGRVMGWNRGAERIHGYAAEEITGQSVAQLSASDERGRKKVQDELRIAKKLGRFESEGWLFRKDGSRFWANVVITRVRDVDGSHAGFSHIVRDLTERKRLEDLLRERAAELSEANRIKDEFLATLSHELRTPLNAVLGWAHLLRTRQLDDDTRRKALDTIERNAKQQSQLIDDLLDVSRIITGKLRLQPRALDPRGPVRAAVDSLAPTAEARDIALVADVEGCDASVFGDPDRLQQVGWNLLSNALKFTPQGGKVSISLKREGSAVRLTVADNGAGIPREFLPYVFDRFRQANGSNTRDHGGLGLGLAIVRHLCELQGGTVAAESEGEGRGATFTVLLPVAGKALVAEEKPQVAEEAPLSGVRILVVDDEPDARELLATVLEEYGATVRTAGSAAEAFEELQKAPVDVLVSDIAMPQEDGYALIRKVRELPPDKGGHTPAVALTAYARVEDRRRALLEGFQMHVAKPIEPMDLAQKVQKLTGRAASGESVLH